MLGLAVLVLSPVVGREPLHGLQCWDGIDMAWMSPRLLGLDLTSPFLL